MSDELIFRTRESFITVLSWKKFIAGVVVFGLLFAVIYFDLPKKVENIGLWCSVVLCMLYVIYILICLWLKSLHRIEVYEDHLHERKGLLNVIETNAPLDKISAISIEIPFWGSIFNYGTLYFDSVGRIDIDSNNIPLKPLDSFLS